MPCRSGTGRELAVTGAVSRPMLDPVALAQLPDAAAFEGAMLLALLQEIGGDVAFLLSDRGPRAVPALRHVGLTTADRLTDPARVAVYEREIAPVKAAALGAGGAVVDTEVLGRTRAHRAAYFRELAAPLGGQSTLYGVLRVRGRVRWVLGLGACGLGEFGAAAQRRFQNLLPGLAVARASYAETASAAATLSPREREVLEYLCLGYTNAEIGAACGTSAFTVRNQLVSVFHKLGASTRAEAVALARAG